ncbi:hypothetical protein GOL85_13415 [Sinorhizobium medicae]|nr:hypothetical protein [Sinorhizobium medicae]
MDALNLGKNDRVILKSCPFCGGPAVEPDGNDFTWCENIACFEGYVHVDTWNRRHDETPSEFERCMK